MFETNFITLLSMFKKHPYMFMNLMLKNNAFTDDFKKKLSNTTIKDKPYFTDINKMMDFYLNIIKDVDLNTDKEIQWNNKLCKAVVEQRFEEAAVIRDYMKLKKYKIYI